VLVFVVMVGHTHRLPEPAAPVAKQAGIDIGGVLDGDAERVRSSAC
jgi:hypothetical protein